MHIPDGYLGPPTCVATYAASALLWTVAARRVKAGLTARKTPLVAVSAAFSFLVMMFNIPIPGGSTGHAIGGVLVAIAIGPWAAALAISVALVIQAVLFGDGGITAIGANCLNMAFMMPFVGYYSYRTIARIFSSNRGKAIAAGLAGWLGLNAAAFSTALMFGLQPIFHTSADGRALYAPYPLGIAIPAMMVGHLLVFGVVEGLVTGLALYYLHQSRSAWILEGTP